MKKSSFVFKVLALLGPEEILKLSEALVEKQALKKAAGEELIVWDDGPPSEHVPQQEAKVLKFQRKSITDLEFRSLQPEPATKEESNGGQKVVSSDVLLWQRELAKEAEGSIQKIDAVKGYQRSSQMFVVKSKSTSDSKLKFASTDGILVNKKQA